MFRKIALGITVLSCSVLLQYTVYATNTDPKNTTKSQSQDIDFEIDRLVDLCAGQANVGIKIVSLKTGRTVYEKNANKLFLPASALKAFTAAAAMATLGSEYKIKTSVWANGDIKDGVLYGDLYLKGGGNPQLCDKDVKELVFKIKLQGIHSIEGKIYVDSFDFDGQTQGPGWMWDDEPEYWNSPMSALIVNHSCLKVQVCPGQKENSPAKIMLHPNTPFVTISNTARTTGEDISDIQVYRNLSDVKNYIQVQGTVAKKNPPTSYFVAIHQPELFAGNIFVDLLIKNKILAKATVAIAKVPTSATLIAEHESQPLSAIVQKMMKESDNLYADCLLKKIGQVRFSSTGSWANGSRAVKEFLALIGLSPEEMVIVDGSGLSRYNLVTPGQFADFFFKMKQNSKFSREFVSALSVAGIDGTLKKNMNEKILLSKVRAKTGSMKGVSTLVGYLTTDEGEELVISVMINGFIGQREKRLENEICKYLLGYKV